MGRKGKAAGLAGQRKEVQWGQRKKEIEDLAPQDVHGSDIGTSRETRRSGWAK